MTKTGPVDFYQPSNKHYINGQWMYDNQFVECEQELFRPLNPPLVSTPLLVAHTPPSQVSEPNVGRQLGKLNTKCQNMQ